MYKDSNMNIHKRYILLNKPYGVVSAFTDSDGHATLKDLVDVPDVYAAGRLDLDSEGLLFLSNDGPLMHALTDPRFEHTKTYFVQVEGLVDAQAVARLEAGVEVKGEMTRRCQAMLIPEPDLPPRPKPVTPHGPTSWLRIVLKEGKKRQIRHMTAAVGFPTLRIFRVAIGPLGVGDLRVGEWRDLLPAEVTLLKKQPRSNAGRTGTARPAVDRPDSQHKMGQHVAVRRTSRPDGDRAKKR
jgi:23S rRNA pseudouridine2457 synthase